MYLENILEKMKWKLTDGVKESSKFRVESKRKIMQPWDYLIMNKNRLIERVNCAKSWGLIKRKEDKHY